MKKMMKKIISAIVIVFIMAFVIIGCGDGTSTSDGNDLPKKIVIGTQNLAEPEAIAKAEGWLESELGTAVEIVNFDGGRDVNTAMAAGEIDFGMLGSVPTALAIANGVDCQVIYIQGVLGDIETLAVNSNLGVKNADGLKGLTIATVFSSTSHYSLLKYLEINGVAPSEVDIVDMKASDIVAAYSRGDIDGAFIWDPQVSELINLGCEKVISAKEMAEEGYATMDVEIVKTSFAEKYPNIVTKYIECMDRAVELYNSDKDNAGNLMAKQLGITAEEALSQVASSTWLTIDEQRSTAWLGGDLLGNNLYETAMFLYSTGDVLDEPQKDIFIKSIHGEYMNDK